MTETASRPASDGPTRGVPRAGLAARFERLKKIVKRRRKIAKADVVVVSHAKSGRTWLATMMSHVYHRRHGIDESELLSFDNFHRRDSRIPRILFSHDNRKDGSHTPLFAPADFRGRKLVLLVRDPRDVAVSAFFQTLRNARKGSSAEDSGEPIYDYVASFKLPRVIAFLQRWQSQLAEIDAALVVRYEDLRARPEAELARLFTFLEGRADPQEIADAVAFASFESLKRKEASNFFSSDKLRLGDSAKPESFKVRRGKVGGYRDYFTDTQLAHIQSLMEAARLDAFGYLPDRPETTHGETTHGEPARPEPAGDGPA